MAETGIVAVDQTAIGALLEGMDAALNEANSLVQELAVNDRSDLAEVEYRQLNTFEQALSKAYTKTEDARKDFKRKWQEPLNRVEAAFKTETAAIKNLLDIYKGELNARDDAEKAAKHAYLEGVYIDFCESSGVANLVANVPFERLMVSTWLNKTCQQKKAEAELIQKVSAILGEWKALCSAPLNFPEEAQRCFFRTLSMREALENDARLKAEEDARLALEAEIRANHEAFMEQERAPEPAPEPEPEPEPAWEGWQEVRRYTLVVDMTDAQREELRGWLRSRGIQAWLRVKEENNGR